MAGVSKTEQFDDIYYLNERIKDLKEEMMALIIKSEERGINLKTSDSRQFDKLNVTINQLMLERFRLLRRSHKNMKLQNNSVLVQNKTNDNRSEINKEKRNQLKIDVWDEEKEGSLELEKQRQLILKAYYDAFPNIDDVIDETGLELDEAEAFTKSILQDLPSGDVNESTTACHVLNSLLQDRNIECLFFDSTHGRNLRDVFRNLTDIGLEDRPFVLKLKSNKGLGGSMKLKSELDVIRFVQIVTKAIEEKTSHPVIEDIVNRLSKVHNIDKKYIRIKTVYTGTFSVVYTVLNLVKSTVKSLTEIGKKLKDQFNEYLTAKIHPLLFRPSFDISLFHELGNKNFSDNPGTYQIGPPGRTKLYTQPAGWTRYGLNVLDKYVDGDLWLEPFQDSRNWYRAFHGTGRASSEDFGDKNQPFQQQFASVDALANISIEGFRPARVAAYGAGVYCSPNPKFPEQGYTGTAEIETTKGKKKFTCMLQVAVNPSGVKFTAEKDIWVVPNPQDIRPYGILIKEA